MTRKYLFQTTVTSSDSNVWISNPLDKVIYCEDLESAKKWYFTKLSGDDFIQVSNNAKKNLSPMYYDDKDGNAHECGFIVKGSTEIMLNDYKWVKKYIDLWVTVSEIINPYETYVNV